VTKKDDGTDRQTEVEGSDRDRIPEIENLARAFRNATQSWNEAGEERSEVQAKLLASMKEHRKKQYRTKTGDLVELVTKAERVKLTRADSE
jgi:predicted house-cleaning noncanonical NTP pyrophosphatase (MazG superfamily)